MNEGCDALPLETESGTIISKFLRFQRLARKKDFAVRIWHWQLARGGCGALGLDEGVPEGSWLDRGKMLARLLCSPLKMALWDLREFCSPLKGTSLGPGQGRSKAIIDLLLIELPKLLNGMDERSSNKRWWQSSRVQEWDARSYKRYGWAPSLTLALAHNPPLFTLQLCLPRLLHALPKRES